MVAIKNLLLLGVSLASAAPWTGLAAGKDSNMIIRDASTVPETRSIHDMAIQKRARARATLQWTNQGIFFFNVALQVPNTVVDLVADSTNIAKQIASDFEEFCLWDPAAPHQAMRLLQAAGAQLGGLYSKQSTGLGTFGVGVQLAQGVSTTDIDYIKKAFLQWGQAGGGLVQVIERANGVLHPGTIGYVPVPKNRRGVDTLSRRTRGDFCPNDNKNLLQYALNQDPVNDDLRWINQCGRF